MSKKLVGVSIWFGAVPPHSATLDLVFRDTQPGDARGRVAAAPTHKHAQQRCALVDLLAYTDKATGMSGAAVIEALERLTRQLSVDNPKD